MDGKRKKNGWAWMVTAVALALLAAGITYQREDLMAAWRVHQLPQSTAETRISLTHKLAQTPQKSAGWLLYALSDTLDAEPCLILGSALASVTADLTIEEIQPLLTRSASLFRGMAPAGQEATVRWAQTVLEASSGKGRLPDQAALAMQRLIEQAYLGEEPAVQAAALQLAAPLFQTQPPKALIAALKQLVQAGVKSADPGVQMQAISAALLPDLDCLEDAAGCLKSPHREVRQAAILALGSATEKIGEETLLPSLHDEDPEIAHLAQTALQARGLREDQIRLGRLMSDPKPSRRLEVLDHLSTTRDIDPALWLRKLSNDPSPAVRVAALRAMAQDPGLELSDRVDQMEANDPSQAVNKLARFYKEHPVQR